jgi:hypothetical protein
MSAIIAMTDIPYIVAARMYACAAGTKTDEPLRLGDVSKPEYATMSEPPSMPSRTSAATAAWAAELRD